MNDLRDFVAWLAAALNRAEIPYMVAGSLASTFHGEHRATNDVDVVIAPDEPQLARFVESLGKEFYVSSAAARDALRRRGMFNVIHPGSGFKADLIVRKARPFSVEEFDRRRDAELLGVRVWLASPEDVILSKLEWSRQGESDRQFRDALGVAQSQWAALNREYLERWSAELGVHDLWLRLAEEVRTRHPPESEGSPGEHP